MSTPVAAYETTMQLVMEVDARMKAASHPDSPGGREWTRDERLYVESGFYVARPWVYRLCDLVAEIGSVARAPEGLESESIRKRWAKRLRPLRRTAAV